MSEAIITVEGLGKRYRLGAGRSAERYTALRDVIATRAAAPFSALKSKWKRRKEKLKTMLRLNFLLQHYHFLIPPTNFGPLKTSASRSNRQSLSESLVVTSGARLLLSNF